MQGLFIDIILLNTKNKLHGECFSLIFRCRNNFKRIICLKISGREISQLSVTPVSCLFRMLNFSTRVFKYLILKLKCSAFPLLFNYEINKYFLRLLSAKQ